MNSSVQLLSEQLELMDKSRIKLEESVIQCKSVTLSCALNHEHEIAFEALMARFSRLSDYLVQRVFRSIDVIELDDSGTVRDRINRAEKKGLIESANEFIKIHTMRNIIAHEYSDEEVLEIYKSVLLLAPSLLNACINIQKYIGRNSQG